MDHQGRAGVQAHQAQAPGQALAEEQVVAVVQGGLGEQFALAALGRQGRRADRQR
jgi:hypothetical protein